ncbi:MAG: hypothetical protein O3A47_04110 [Chloroflexi bacterium]|nr:hypothetical protein [Chloroflexota bacterium]
MTITTSTATHCLFTPDSKPNPESVTTVSNPGTFIRFDEQGKEVYDAICGPTLPMWMVLHLPRWIVGPMFWIKTLGQTR